MYISTYALLPLGVLIILCFGWGVRRAHLRHREKRQKARIDQMRVVAKHELRDLQSYRRGFH